jgi:hypothetical protein
MEVDPLYLALFIGALFISTGLMKSRVPFMVLIVYVVVAFILELHGGYGRPLGGLALMTMEKLVHAIPSRWYRP